LGGNTAFGIRKKEPPLALPRGKEEARLFEFDLEPYRLRENDARPRD